MRRVKLYIPDHAVENAAATDYSTHGKSTCCTVELCLRNAANIPVVGAANVISDVYWKLNDLFVVIPESIRRRSGIIEDIRLTMDQLRYTEQWHSIVRSVAW